MPEVLDWRTVADPRGAVRRLARVLHQGRIALLPVEGGYGLAVGGCGDAADRLPAGRCDRPALAVRGVGEARDWAPGLGRLGRRLARRLWPGPLTLELTADGGPSLTARLDPAARRAVLDNGSLRLRAPGHEATRELLRILGGPLLLADLPALAGPRDAAAELGAVVDVVLEDGPPRPEERPTLVRLDGDAWTVRAPGAVSEEVLRQQSACLVLFLCTGNTCRSPLAEALCKRRLADRLGCGPEDLAARGVYVLSAGLAASVGGGAALEAVAVARSFGADLTTHRSRPLSPDLAVQADHLIAMTRGHLQALTDHYPRLGARPRLLSPCGDDLADPIGHDLEVYEACGRQIWQDLEGLVPELLPSESVVRSP